MPQEFKITLIDSGLNKKETSQYKTAASVRFCSSGNAIFI